MDVNDETPELYTSTECTKITETLPLYETITVLTATDRDDTATPNGQVIFSIVDGNKDGLFDIEQLGSNRARIISRTSLHGKAANYSLIIKAADGGRPARFSTGRVLICVKEVRLRTYTFILLNFIKLQFN